MTQQPPKPSPPPVLLADVRIQNFRGLSHVATSLEGLTVFVGENNAGKSSILQALATFFGDHRATEDDLFVSGTGVRAPHFVIDVRFVPGVGLKFNADVQARLIGKIQLPTTSAAPQFYAIRATGAFAPDGSGITLERRFLRGWSDDPIAAAALAVFPEHPTREQLSLVTFFLLDARRDLVEELRTRNSHWGRLLSDLGLDAATRLEIEKVLGEVGKSIVASSPVLGSVKAGLDAVKETLGASVSSIEIAPVPGRVDDLARAVDVLIARPAGPALPLRLQGHGSRSLAAVMVFESFVKERARAGGHLAPLVVSAFEEPEAHLHPQAHRAMLGLIASLDGQKLVSTHSPYVARVADIHSVRCLTKSAAMVHCRAVPRTTSGARTFSDEAMVNVRKFVQRNNGEVLFARVVVIVEGDTEDFALPVFARHMWKKDHGLLAVSFAHSGGAMNGQHIVRLLDHLGVPWVLLADGDAEGTKGIKAIEKAIGRRLGPDEYVQLPAGAPFERYLVDAGYRDTIEETISAHYGDSTLSDLKRLLHGTPGPKSTTRDYTSSGWQDRLVLDFCLHEKGRIGEVLAEGIVSNAAKHGKPEIPPEIENLLNKAAKWLK